MAYYHECPYCQGSLDPGETCDCQKEQKEAEKQAKRKLARIIEREGDADGERLKPYYLAQLVAEAVTAERFSNYCNMLHELRTLEKKEMPAAKAARQV